MSNLEETHQPLLPLVSALETASNNNRHAFFAPGHKQGRGITPALQGLLGAQVFKADLPELPELDNLFAPEGVIAEAQALAAQLWGAEQSWFLVNGSTVGIIAAILATCGAGDKLLLPRNSHQAAIAGVIHSGAVPIFIEPVIHPDWDLAWSITPAALAHALKQHPDAKALLLLHPTYHGVAGEMQALVNLAHDYHLPVIVDEAHAAHFSFHPGLPPSALSCGADISVQSTQKD